MKTVVGHERNGRLHSSSEAWLIGWQLDMCSRQKIWFGLGRSEFQMDNDSFSYRFSSPKTKLEPTSTLFKYLLNNRSSKSQQNLKDKNFFKSNE